MRVAVAVAVALVSALGLARAARPTHRDLYLGGDLAELRRQGERGSIGALIAAARSPDRTAVLAALTALPAHPDAVVALDALAVVAASWDRSVAAPAARAAEAIAAGVDGDRAIRDDLDDDALARAADAWAALAARGDRWSDVRGAALTIAARLTAARAATADAPPAVAALLAAAYRDGDPELRLAALDATPAPVPDALAPAVIELAATDPVPAVRLVAAQALCAVDARAAVAALGEPGRDALRAVVAQPVDRTGALLDAARCLAADDDPRSQRALQALRHHAPRELRRALATLGRRAP